MNYADMDNTEILQEVKCCIVDNTKFEGFLEVLSRIKAKTITAAEFQEAQRQGYEITYPLMMAAYKEGKYFGSQGLDFLSCMMLAQEEVELEQARWSEFQGAAIALGKFDSPEFAEIRDFGKYRCERKFEDRRKFLHRDGSNRPIDELTPALQKEFARVRDEFYEVCKRWGWPYPQF